MCNKKIILLFICVCAALFMSAKKSDYKKIDRFIIEGRDQEYADSKNFDLILPMCIYDSVQKKEILDYVLLKYKDSTAYPIRQNLMELLSIISLNKTDRIQGDPLWLRHEYFNVAIKFADHANIYDCLLILHDKEYSEPEKQELIRILRRNYPFDAGISYANYCMNVNMYASLKTKAVGLARKNNLNTDSLYNELVRQEYDKHRNEFDNRRTSKSFLFLLGKLNVTEVISDLEKKLISTDSIEAYYSSLALARMGNKNGESYLIKSTLLYSVEMYSGANAFYTKNQEVVCAYAKKELQNENLFYCDPDVPDRFPECYATLEYLQRKIVNMPKFLEGNPCYEKEYRDALKLKAAQKWIEENKGKYQFAE